MSDVCCNLCGANVWTSRSYLKRDEQGWHCAGGCNGESMTFDERLLAAIEDDDEQIRISTLPTK